MRRVVFGVGDSGIRPVVVPCTPEILKSFKEEF